FVSLFITICPPLPPLFPYTTLFRSNCPRQPPLNIAMWFIRGHENLVIVLNPESRQVNQQAVLVRHDDMHLFDHRELLQHLCSHRDRKSTRLNSSHVSISYAVFCLKK